MPTEFAAERHVWRDHAACIGKPMSWFYASEHWSELTAQALMICQRCPVREQCLADALDFEVGDRVVYGIRGGLASERERIIRGRVVVVEPEPDSSSLEECGGLHEVYAAAI